jgi:hypothetical protein
MRYHPFGNPAILTVRTRGFASPDCSGFALIGDVLVINQVSQSQNRDFTQSTDILYNRKRASFTPDRQNKPLGRAVVLFVYDFR